VEIKIVENNKRSFSTFSSFVFSTMLCTGSNASTIIQEQKHQQDSASAGD